MRGESEHAPLLPWRFAAGRVSGATVCAHGLGRGATRRQCASIPWMAPPLVQAGSGRQAPDALAPRRCRVHRGEGERCIAGPHRGLTGPAECATLVQHPRDGVRHVAVWRLCATVDLGAPTAHRHFPPPVAPPDVIVARVPRALPPHAEGLVGHRALHPQPQARIALAGIIEAIRIDASGVAQGAAGHAMRPVTVVAGQARRCHGEDGTPRARTHGGQPRANTRSFLTPSAASADSVSNADALGNAHILGALGHARLTAAAVLRVADLSAG